MGADVITSEDDSISNESLRTVPQPQVSIGETQRMVRVCVEFKRGAAGG